MTITNIKSNTYSATIDEENGARQPEDAAASTASASDTYSANSANSYQGLISGTSSSLSPIAELLGEVESMVSKRDEDPIQALIGNLMMGDASASKPKASDFEVPQVPDLQKDILDRDPEIQRNMVSVIARYEGVEQMILSLIEQNKTDISPSNNSKFLPDELMAKTKYGENLEQALYECRKQLDEARFYYEWDRKDRAAQAADNKGPDEVS